MAWRTGVRLWPVSCVLTLQYLRRRAWAVEEVFFRPASRSFHRICPKHPLDLSLCKLASCPPPTPVSHASPTMPSAWTSINPGAFNSPLWTLSEKAMAPHSSTLAWKIPWTEEPGRLQSMGSLRVRHDWATSLSLFTFMCWRRKWQPTPVFLPGESQGRGSLVGCRLWGCTESDTTEAT